MRVPYVTLRALVRDVFTARGMPPEYAGEVADALVWADLRGVDSHGVVRVPRYLELFDRGAANPRPDLTVERRRAALAVVDADGAPGPVALAVAVRTAVEAARDAGVGWVAVRNAVHTGAIGRYPLRAAEAGMAGLTFVAGMPQMAYAGTVGAGVGTSPLAVGVPAGRHPHVLLDMATAVVAFRRFAEFRAAGRPLPTGAALDADGVPTTDPAAAVVPLPVGGAKGSGLSLVFELLASGLTANPILAVAGNHRQNATVVAVDVAAFLPVAEFTALVDDTIDAVHALPVPAGRPAARVPGERGARTYRERSVSGIPLPAATWAALAGAATDLGVPVPRLP